jgi:hypothetical protein
MEVTSIFVPAIVVLIFGWIAFRHRRTKQEIAAKSIEPEALYELLKLKQVKLYDVRQPLDFLANPVIIQGAIRIAPKEIPERTMSFARDQDSVIYCTGGDDDTTKMVLERRVLCNLRESRSLRVAWMLGTQKDIPWSHTQSHSIWTRRFKIGFTICQRDHLSR